MAVSVPSLHYNTSYSISIKSNSGVYFRAHAGTGEFLRERHCPAQAGYNELSVLGTIVPLCVTSTDPIPPDWQTCPSRSLLYRRLDFEAGYTKNLPNNLVVDAIATWNADIGDLCMVKIPQFCLENIEVQWLFSSLLSSFPDIYL